MLPRMTRIVAVLALLLVCPFGVRAGQISVDDSLKSTLLARSDAFMQNWQRRNMTALAESLAPEFLYIGPEGVAPKEGVVAALAHCTLSEYKLSDVQLRQTSADSAALIYRIHQTGECEGHPLPPETMNTDTLVRRGGKWLFVMTTETVVRQP